MEKPADAGDATAMAVPASISVPSSAFAIFFMGVLLVRLIRR